MKGHFAADSKMKRLLVVAVAVCCATALAPALRFKSDHSFKLVQFTDLHYGKADRYNSKSQHIQNVILQAEEPDVAVFTGDLIEGSEGDPEESWKLAVQPLVEHNTPWGVVFGNNDASNTEGKQQLMQLDTSYSLSFSQPGPTNVSGVGNYIIPIFSSGVNVSSCVNVSNPVVALAFLDSGVRDCMGVKGYGCVMPDQIDWLKSEIAQLPLQCNASVPLLVFFHIPFQQYMNVWNEETCFGHKFERVCCSAADTGLFDLLSARGNVLGVFVGHDHMNNYGGVYGGVPLYYGRKSGYPPPLPLLNGARLISLDEHDLSAINTWQVVEDGDVEPTPEHKPHDSLQDQCHS
eukprot:TRINITY_DN2939_c0_g1_i2.p1 TRINITY_DN2939_c0_g1~~TRINITY_DN2939_c0_g1_i2.p1  ORF type:complete len:348 (-),score=79.19 TRINITY_DN2939_c0_g1_i2:101-1144(-)